MIVPYVDKRKNLEQKLSCCRLMHHSPYNFSLMPKTGGMNNRKKQDRPDWLLYAICNFYSNIWKFKVPVIEKNEIVTAIDSMKEDILKLQNQYVFITNNANSINDLHLFSFLLQIGTFEKYVEKFYNLNVEEKEDKELLNRLIFAQPKIIKNEDDLEKYMDLAIAYWKFQQRKYEIYSRKD